MEDRVTAAGTAEAELVSMAATPETAIPFSGEPALLGGGGGVGGGSHNNSKSWTPTGVGSLTITPRYLSPSSATPVKRVMVNLRGYLEEVGHLTKLNPQDTWLPITESRSGNAHYAAFHNLTAGIGFQALLLPVAFSFLGW